MNRVLALCSSPASARLALRVAADLHWGYGAPVSLAFVPSRPQRSGRRGLDAIGMLSDVLFEPGGAGYIPEFDSPAMVCRIRDVLANAPAPVDDFTEIPAESSLEAIVRLVDARGASPVLAAGCDALALRLRQVAAIPVWMLQPSSAEQPARIVPLQRAATRSLKALRSVWPR